MTDIENPTSPAPETNPKLPPPPGAPPPPIPPPKAEEKQTSAAAIVKRWKKEDIIKRASLSLRGLAVFFSLLAFIIMACNRHVGSYKSDYGEEDLGNDENFDDFEEYRYLLAVAVIGFVYSGGQLLRQVHELYTKRPLFEMRVLSFLNFSGDQIMAYMLISSSSAAISLTNILKTNTLKDVFEYSYNDKFTDTSAASISMAFLAFVALAVSALISGYNLATLSYI